MSLQAGLNIFGKTCMIRGGKGALPFETDPARRPAKRPFGRDVNLGGLPGCDELVDAFFGKKLEANFPVPGQGQRAALRRIGANDIDFVP